MCIDSVQTAGRNIKIPFATHIQRRRRHIQSSEAGMISVIWAWAWTS